MATSGELGERRHSTPPAAGTARTRDATAVSAVLPSGLVTFVLTDIEGSTKLFRRLGEQYVELLEIHRSLLRTAIARHGGVELGTEGDSLLVVFADAAEALAACLDGQRSLDMHDWPTGAVLRVRMGVHTGEATPLGNDYVSLAIHQLARVASSAHGGQILVSEATANEVATRLPPAATLTPLGSFQLRGFARPERLFQLRHPDLPADFPPPRAVGVVAHNVPFHRSPFVGRRAERSGLAEVLMTTGVVSVVGLGGVGKTRLAVQVAFDVMDRFADGAWLVELAPLTDRASIVHELANVLAVTPQSGRSTENLLVEHLATKSALLMFDNCEHVVDIVAELIEFLSQRCPHVVFLATSREPLDVEGEVVWRIGPLPTVAPEAVRSLEDVGDNDAVRLFVSRAKLVQPDFQLTDDNAADVAAIVGQVNGIPLAIELAAAALEDRSLAGVVRGLADRFALLTHGRRTAPDRHQTLRAALLWSLDLLRAEDRQLLAELSVFAGAGSVAAAAAICCGGGAEEDDIAGRLRRLARASLLTLDPDDSGRWSMLESIRELAALELAASDREAAVHERYRTWFLQFVEEVTPQVGRRHATPVLAALEADHDNIRRAIHGALVAGDPETALRMATAMAPYWMSHGEWSYGIHLLEEALAGEGGPPQRRTNAQIALGNLLLLRGDLDEAERLFAGASSEDAGSRDDLARARALSGRGFVSFRRSRLREAEEDWQVALELAERSGDQRVVATLLRNLAIAAGSRGHQDVTGTLLERAHTAAQNAGDDQLLRLVLASIGEMKLWLGEYTAAESAFGEALDIADTIGDLAGRPIILSELGWIALLRSELSTAMRISVDAAELAEDLGNRRTLAHSLRLQGETWMRMGRLSAAHDALAAAATTAELLSAPAEIAGVQCSQACLALEQQALDDARRNAQAAIDAGGLRHTMLKTSPEWVLGVAALMADDAAEAADQFQRSLNDAVYASLPRHEAAGSWGLGRVDASRGDLPGAASRYLRAIELWDRIGDRLGLAESLVALAQIGALVDAESAVGLLASATDLRRASQAVLTPREEHELAAALEAIGRDRDDLVTAPDRAVMAPDGAAIVERAHRLARQLGAEAVSVGAKGA